MEQTKDIAQTAKDFLTALDGAGKKLATFSQSLEQTNDNILKDS